MGDEGGDLAALGATAAFYAAPGIAAPVALAAGVIGTVKNVIEGALDDDEDEKKKKK
jgi:hypothetical protein